MAKYLIVIFSVISLQAFGQDDIPDSAGFTGYFFLLPGVFYGQSNVVSAGPPLLGDIGNATISSIDEEPETNQAFAFGAAGELSYKFKDSRTQVFFGNRLEDILRLDVPFGIGIRQELPDKSILAGSFLLTPLELLFWSDPFVEGIARKETYLFYPGIRIRWGRILGTGLELTLTGRQYSFERESSGNWLYNQGRLSQEELKLLNRNGEILKLMLLYRIDIKKHRFEPAFRYIFDERFGKAISQNGYSLQLTYIYRINNIILDFNFLYGQRFADEIHPVYAENLRSDGYGAAFTTIVPFKKFKSSVLAAIVSAEALVENASIKFYNSSISSVFVGVMWKHLRN